MQTEACSDFVVGVDYAKPINYLISLMRDSFERIEASKRQIEVDEDISEKKFPLTAQEQKTKKIIAFNLLSFYSEGEEEKEGIYSARAIEEIGKQGHSPGNIRDFLFFAARYPKIASADAIVILGSVLIGEAHPGREGFKSVPIFTRRDGKFCLGPIWYKGKWPIDCKFFARNESASFSFISY